MTPETYIQLIIGVLGAAASVIAALVGRKTDDANRRAPYRTQLTWTILAATILVVITVGAVEIATPSSGRQETAVSDAPRPTSGPPTPTSTSVSPSLGQRLSFPNSPDGKLQAIRTPDTLDYIVKKVATGQTLITTHAQRDYQKNDVKVGAFCSDGKFFAAAYHYNPPLYTWIGYWNLETGMFDHGVVVDNQRLYSLEGYC